MGAADDSGETRSGSAEADGAGGKFAGAAAGLEAATKLGVGTRIVALPAVPVAGSLLQLKPSIDTSRTIASKSPRTMPNPHPVQARITAKCLRAQEKAQHFTRRLRSLS
jgi:hypothetical protein